MRFQEKKDLASCSQESEEENCVGDCGWEGGPTYTQSELNIFVSMKYEYTA